MLPTILAVDDEVEVLNLLETALSSEGFSVVTAGTIAEFWLRDAAVDADLYIVDLTLPDGNGFSVIRELRRRGDRGIIILTGRGDETDQVLGLELGADDYVTKPFRLRELTARVNAVLRRTQGRSAAAAAAPPVAPAPQAQPTLRVDHEFDGYQVILAARQLLSPEGAEIYLTTAEFDLLSALLQRRGQVLNRDQIMNAIKGRDWESYDRVVDGIVSRLRRKIPVLGARSHYIRTVHGVGYSFVG
jgi:two-component system torCAD operon response regulator TorR